MIKEENLPENYELVKLGDVLSSITNGTTSTQNEEDNGYRVTRIETIANGEIDLKRTNFVELNKEKYDKFKLNEGDILFSHINSTKHIGKTAIYHSEMGTLIHGMNLLRLVPKKEIISPKFLLYLLKNKKTRAFYQTRCKRAVNQSSLDQKTIKKFEFILPPLKTQQKIVEILEKAEKLKEWRAETDVLTNEYLKSLFLEMFGHTGINPKKWPLMKATDICSKEKNAIKAGPFGSSLKKEFYVEKGYKIYGQEQVIKDDLSYGNYYIPEEIYKKLQNCKIKEGDILISLVGSYGKISIVPKEFEPGIINPRLMKISLNQKIVSPLFFRFLLNSDGIKKKIEHVSHGGTMNIINVKIIKQLDFPIPPIQLQNQFAEIVQNVEQLKEEQKQSKAQIDNLFNALMQKAFKGELTC
ncbi:restriction endonuclease subunit S [Methanobacterium paludis]|uniref:Restriction modification system DNA specificity domain protein n=1 Tax=Methanobacterium paludis (strain DSM 25820 / JCM 18151 / SWAN1) TaxID=868131 RepID=F6D6M2_METPW|nr:restriction endonuclease subunit S [Methanobacterium paludis]AEG17735.1 restriction modification system DNA specificity domain protein [Methanobacterium paludis]